MPIESGHWYTAPEGKPAYTVIGKNGQERNTTLADARKLGLVPSVTTVLSILDKPGLNNWKVRQGILAALTLTRIEGETDEDFLVRLFTDSEQQAKEAAEEGTRIHEACEAAYKWGAFDSKYTEHVKATGNLIESMFPDVHDWVAEKSFAHPLGFGGKVDLHSPSTGIVIDYKSAEIKPDEDKRLAYDQNRQLAAYQFGLGFPVTRCANVFISRCNPGHVVGHVWRENEIADGLSVFEQTLSLWKCLKQYNPMFEDIERNEAAA